MQKPVRAWRKSRREESSTSSTKRTSQRPSRLASSFSSRLKQCLACPSAKSRPQPARPLSHCLDLNLGGSWIATLECCPDNRGGNPRIGSSFNVGLAVTFLAMTLMN